MEATAEQLDRIEAKLDALLAKQVVPGRSYEMLTFPSWIGSEARWFMISAADHAAVGGFPVAKRWRIIRKKTRTSSPGPLPDADGVKTIQRVLPALLLRRLPSWRALPEAVRLVLSQRLKRRPATTSETGSRFYDGREL